MKLLDLVTKYGSGTTLKQKINSSLTHIFDFGYPIYSEAHRLELEKKIVMRYINRETCYEDEDMFKLAMDSRLNEIMPFYNQLYASAELEIEPLINMKHTTTTQDNNSSETNVENLSSDTVITHSTGSNKTQTANGQTTQNSGDGTTNSNDSSSTNEQTTGHTGGTSTTNGSHNEITRVNDTPNGSIQSLTDSYLTSATQVSGSNNSAVTNSNSEDRTSSSTQSHSISGSNTYDDKSIVTGQSATDNSTEQDATNNHNGSSNSKTNVLGSSTKIDTHTGLSGASESKLLMEYRETIINIDEKIINDVGECFTYVYDFDII